MKKLTIEESFEFYLSSLERCNMSLLDANDEKIEYEIFEEFTMEYPAALSKYTLDVLENEGIIDDEIKSLSKNLQKELLQLNGSSLWNIESFKSSSEWKEVLELANKIKELIHEKWTDEELVFLLGK